MFVVYSDILKVDYLQVDLRYGIQSDVDILMSLA